MLVIMCPKWHTPAGGGHCQWLPSGGVRYPGQVWTYFPVLYAGALGGGGGYCQVSSFSNHLSVESLGYF